MKKEFKTIMALTAALAISMSGMCITSAEDVIPDQNGDMFGNKNILLSVEDKLAAEINFGAMKLTFDLNKNTWDENSFSGTNNQIEIYNRSTCPLALKYGIVIYNADILTSNFRLTSANNNGNENLPADFITYCTASAVNVASNSDEIFLDEGDESTKAYLTVGDPEYFEGYLNTEFGVDDVNIGCITVLLSKYSV